MKASDLSELAVRNLREALLRNALTTLGVAVGVASLVAMLSLGVGLQQFAANRLARTGLFDAVFVAPRAELRGFRRRENPPPTAGQTIRPLDEAGRLELERLPNVVEVYPPVRFVSEVRYAGNPYPTLVAGLPNSSRMSGAFEGMQGTFFSSPSADEAILQIEFAKELSNHPSTLLGQELALRYGEREALRPQNEKRGSTASDRDHSSPPSGFSVVLREKKLRIVGIVSADPEGFGGFGRGRVFVPLEVAEGLRAAQANDLRDVVRGSGAAPTYASLTVRVKSPAEVPDVEAKIKGLGFNAFSLFDTTRNLRLFFAVFDLLLGIFGGLALVVATLGIVNTLVMAILERRREIGVLKALGAADLDVKQLFFAEAGFMGLVGGTIGVGLGWLIGRALTFGTDLYLRRQNLPEVDISSVPWWLVVGAIGFALLVSLAAGIYPASRAARLNPVEALRYE